MSKIIGKRIIKVLGLLLLLYLFLVSIKLLGASLKLFGKGFAETLIQSSSNPLVGLFIGILTTSLVQSSSVTTCIVVGLVGGGLLNITNAIPIIMGANIGTTVTNTLISLSFVTRKLEFRKAFGGAIVHDLFNLLAVTLFLPLELSTHFLERSALFLTRLFENAGGVNFTSPLKIIIDPFIQFLKHSFLSFFSLSPFLSGLIMLLIAFALLFISLIYLVRIARSLAIQRAEVSVNKYLFRNDFAALLLGLSITAVIQSSSITTSLVIPLVGAGIVSLARVYPYTLGANVGTTVTAILASLATVATQGSGAHTAGVTIAFTHLLFNICGIAVFYPLKKIPISLAKGLGRLVAESRRWSILYILAAFYLVPFLIIFIASKF
jgi:sodium-dependent phosphate cotransporter